MSLKVSFCLFSFKCLATEMTRQNQYGVVHSCMLVLLVPDQSRGITECFPTGVADARLLSRVYPDMVGQGLLGDEGLATSFAAVAPLPQVDRLAVLRQAALAGEGFGALVADKGDMGHSLVLLQHRRSLELLQTDAALQYSLLPLHVLQLHQGNK